MKTNMIVPKTVQDAYRNASEQLLHESGNGFISRKGLSLIWIAKIVGIFLAFFVTLSLGWSETRAEEIHFPGDSLRTDPLYLTNSSLYPLASLSDNTVTVETDITNGSVYGGIIHIAPGNLETSRNNVFLNSAVISLNITGGHVNSSNGRAAANYNYLKLIDSEASNVNGGDSYSNNGLAEANYNTVEISGGYYRYNIYGGEAMTLGANDLVTSDHNQIVLDDVEIGNCSGCYFNVYSGYSVNYATVGDAVANNNIMEANNVTHRYSGLLPRFYVGYAFSVNSGAATSQYNKGSLSNLNARTLYGGLAGIYSDSQALAEYNELNFSDGAVSNIVVAGYIETYHASGYATAYADHNTLNIIGGDVSYAVGGAVYSLEDGNFDYASASDNVVTLTDTTANLVGGGDITFWKTSSANQRMIVNNTVNLVGDTIVNTELFGGYYNGASYADAFSGNVLNIANPGAGGIVAKDVYSFNYFNFTFDLNTPNNSTGLTISSGGTAYLSDSWYTIAPNTPSVIASVNTDGGNPLAVGQTLTLIDVETYGGSVEKTYFTQDSAEGRHGSLINYEFDLYFDGNGNLLAEVKGVSPDKDRFKSISEGFLGGAAMIIQGSDQIVSAVVENAVAAAKAERAGVLKRSPIFAPFFAASGWSVRYKTGSHVDVNGFSWALGLSSGQDLSPGRLTLGVFAEYGVGFYNTFNSFANSGSLRGDGDTRYIGGGVLGHFDFRGSARGNFYAEMSARAGRVKNDYHNDEYVGILGRPINYESSVPYFGFHFGTGYKFALGESGDLNAYGKYIWTRVGSDKVTLSSGEPVSFDAVNSHRVRAGARYEFAVNESINPYFGLAYEREFNSKSKGEVYGVSFEPPEMEGSTGIGEVGLRFGPFASSAFSANLGFQGYVGKRQGYSGSLVCKFEF
ncbi:MAG: autotransporter outer membrane beta-barrel domain-containing protein [Deltaproteobacteria bacterium]|jgi:hypothetical protein|nr:autotransporter outer membrane beta-barrel domain-containing protein [Deltaproteobacteria bacterium]